MGENFKKRIDTWKDTQKRCENYEDPDISIKYSWDPNYKYNINRFHKVRYNVLPYDTLDVAKAFSMREYYKPLVLNMADDFFPGGNVELGSGAQEESIFRRSNIYRTLDINKYYPIKYNEAIYSANVSIFKDNELRDFCLYEKPIKLDILSCPGIRKPQLTEEGRLTDEQKEILRKKIELICQIGDKYNHNMLVLGALGCGAWCNPPEDVAIICKEVLEKVRGCFRIVVFAILPKAEKGYITKLDENRQSNVDIFKRIFDEIK